MCVGAPRGLLHTLHWVHISLALYPAALAAAPAPQMPYLSPASCSSVSSKLPAPCSDTVTERPSRTAKRTACEYCPASGGANVTVTFCVRGWPKPRPSSFPPAGDTTNWPKRASDLAAAATSSAEPGSFTLPAVGTAPHVASTSVGLLSVSSSTFGACTCTRPNSRLAPSPGRASAAATCSAGCNTVPDTGSRCTSPFPYVTTSAPSRRKSSAGNSTGPLAAAVSELRRRRAGDARVREGLVRPAAPGAASWGTNCRVTSTLSAGGRWGPAPEETSTTHRKAGQVRGRLQQRSGQGQATAEVRSGAGYSRGQVRGRLHQRSGQGQATAEVRAGQAAAMVSLLPATGLRGAHAPLHLVEGWEYGGPLTGAV
eukprot:365255-Chlamydomonas_euryale.AAC.41